MILRTCKGSWATLRAGLFAKEQGGMLSTRAFGCTPNSQSRVLAKSLTVCCKIYHACGLAVITIAVLRPLASNSQLCAS